VCRAAGRPGRFLEHAWVNGAEVPRFYPNLVTLTHGEAAEAEQRKLIETLQASHLPGRWAVKDSFNTLDLSRAGFDVLLEASWIRNVMPVDSMPSDIVWSRVAKGPVEEDPNFTMFEGRRGFLLVAGGMLYRAEGVVGLTNVVAEAADAVAVWRSLSVLAAQTFPRTPLVGYESGVELGAALDAGFEAGDPLRVWVRGS
jgi:hypothetical protein